MWSSRCPLLSTLDWLNFKQSLFSYWKLWLLLFSKTINCSMQDLLNTLCHHKTTCFTSTIKQYSALANFSAGWALRLCRIGLSLKWWDGEKRHIYIYTHSTLPAAVVPSYWPLVVHHLAACKIFEVLKVSWIEFYSGKGCHLTICGL